MQELNYQFDTEAVTKLPQNVRFGSSTWTYPGWQGLIYKRAYKNEKLFKQNCLEEYATFPLFRTVGIDSSFYSPLSEKQLKHYASQVPQDFLWASKVWERVTIPVYPKHARYGPLAGKVNPDFLNPALFGDEVLKPCCAPEVLPHIGPFIFEFQTFSRELLAELDFLSKLKSFLQALPGNFKYAVEIRTPALLNKDYFAVLNECGATHCFNHWYIMPPLKEQMLRAADAGGLKANFFVARLLTPLGVKYEGAVKLFEPYDKIKKPNPEMRRDAARLALRAVQRHADAWIIVNNRSEGNSPMTIEAIIKMVADELEAEAAIQKH